jgi:hypothetical protein
MISIFFDQPAVKRCPFYFLLKEVRDFISTVVHPGLAAPFLPLRVKSGLQWRHPAGHDLFCVRLQTAVDGGVKL